MATSAVAVVFHESSGDILPVAALRYMLVPLDNSGGVSGYIVAGGFREIASHALCIIRAGLRTIRELGFTSAILEFR